MARSAALDIVTKDYITITCLRGERAASIARREMLPNATGVLLVEFATRAGFAPVLIGSLGFLGFGMRPPTLEWGLMISEYRGLIFLSPATVAGPGLAVLAQIADRVGVMYAGRMVEVAPVDTLFREPRHPYTRGLIGSVPRLDEDDVVPFAAPLRGLLRRGELGSGCAFAHRCDYAGPACEARTPPLEPLGNGHHVACFRWCEIGPAPRPPASAGSERVREPGSRPVLELGNVSVAYGPAPTGFAGRLRRASPPVVHDVSFRIAEGETFALVGESGSGKSTIARAVSGLLAPRTGEILFRGEPVAGRVGARPPELRGLVQYVFQNPDASLNPRMRIRNILARPLELLGNVAASELDSAVADALDDVRLDADYADRFPDQLSGGERQRIAIARALIVDPALLLCDEVLSALDVSVQASILDLLRRLRARHRVSMLFISHDLAVVRTLADHIGVMYQGRLLETGSNDEVFAPPHHPYTRLLLHAVPGMRARRRTGEAAPTSDRAPTQVAEAAFAGTNGCVFAGRCPRQIEGLCETTPPPWRRTGETLRLRCHREVDEL